MFVTPRIAVRFDGYERIDVEASCCLRQVEQETVIPFISTSKIRSENGLINVLDDVEDFG